MSSLIDAFNNFVKSLQPQEVGQLNLRSCLGCSFHKEILKDHFCTQVQPPSKIFNPYDAQLCIYYTPETATTGQITKAERETQSSQLDLIKRINLIDLITAITNIANIASLDLIDRITLIDSITSIGTIGEITRIKDAPFYRENIIANYNFQTGDLTGWHPTGSPTVKYNGGYLSFTGFYVLSLKGHGPSGDAVGQALSRPVLTNDVVSIYILARTVAGNYTLIYRLLYTDGTLTDTNCACTVNWTSFTITPTANKTLAGITLISPWDVGCEIYVDNTAIIVAERIVSPATPVIYAVTMTNANAQYSQALPSDTRRFSIKTRDGTAFRLAYVTGKVAPPTDPYLTIPANMEYSEDDLRANITLYFACGTAGKIVEIVAWS
jgi:hypothetical protein